MVLDGLIVFVWVPSNPGVFYSPNMGRPEIQQSSPGTFKACLVEGWD